MGERKDKESWDQTTLGEIAKWGSGGTPKRSELSYYKGGSIPWVKTGDLNDDIVQSASEYITEEGLKNSSAKLFPKGAICLAMYGATIGKTGVLGMEAATNQACAVAVVKPSVDPQFLWYYLKASKQKFISIGKGGAQPNISQTVIKNFPFPKPLLNEQKELVERLDRFTGRQSKIEVSLSRLPGLLADFRESVLNKVFDELSASGSKVAVPFKYVTSGSRGWAKFYSSQGDSFIRITNLNRRTIAIDLNDEKMKYVSLPPGSEGKRTNLKEGDILVSITADLGLIGLVGSDLASEDAYINQHIALARPKPGFIPAFVAYYLVASGHGQKKFHEGGKGAVKSGLRLDDIRTMTVPDVSEDNQLIAVSRIEALLKIADQIETRMVKLKTKVEDLPQAVLGRAFRGEL